METTASDLKYMWRCLELARKGKGKTGLNPLVGSVVVHNDRIIGEGYHEKFGAAHAEVNAISSVKDKDLLPESTLYVNLEPCSHFGKTPPCSLLIKDVKIPRVVIGVKDPNPKVSGRGIAILEEAGVMVETGVLESESIHLNRRFFTNILKNRPYIILKWAESKDGFMDKIREKDSPVEPTWITNQTARMLVHKWRGEEDAIFAGVNTVIMDNPELNLRDWSGKQPVRVTLDRNNRIPATAKIKNGINETIIFSNEIKNESGFTHREVSSDFNLEEMMEYLYKKEIGSILVEGGSKIIKSLLELGLWDEARVFIGRVSFGDGVKAQVLPIPAGENIDFSNNLLIVTHNKIY